MNSFAKRNSKTYNYTRRFDLNGTTGTMKLAWLGITLGIERQITMNRFGARLRNQANTKIVR